MLMKTSESVDEPNKFIQHTHVENLGTALSEAGESKFFGRVAHLLWQIAEYLRLPNFVVPTSLGNKVLCLLSTDSQINVPGVANLTNLNTIDSREIVWANWNINYNAGIRDRIV